MIATVKQIRESSEWRLVQNSTGRVIRTFATEEDAWFYQHHDSMYPVSEYTICGPGQPLDLPNWIGRKWLARTQFCTTIREGATWRYGELIEAGALLEFAGWAGTGRREPFASFVSPDKPGCVIFLLPSGLQKWCVEVPEATVKLITGEDGWVDLVKVRIVDDCDCGEGV